MITDNYIVKVCGMRDVDNIREVEALGIDWMGFIFWPKSSRYVSEVPAYLPKNCKRVGVFVDASIGDVMSQAETFSLDIIQLHGQESPSYIAQLTSHLSALTSIKIIKALNIATTADLEATKRYEGVVDYFLFDTKGKMVGGNGEKFDWSVLEAYHGSTPFLLSGGIGPDDAERVRAFNHPKCIGIDLNSKFELSPALKDVNMLRNFLSSF
ncbi:phosphoribosylanthranilate isomerase [Xylanibacter ruminicola]|uniref:N-(5'-phosphoribosyl)anthranilate isomerase n=1 Tax=Xylanibacter ruminicola TaxID=839 RepID=A0A1M6T9M7_XYLRU|nr:phosphoribosylanthranilate isomerase [Xylanibacter ruminicola]SHK53584.1 phosphoribosylanthranilate isomerase [Xylanibacter ruminicola]